VNRANASASAAARRTYRITWLLHQLYTSFHNSDFITDGLKVHLKSDYRSAKLMDFKYSVEVQVDSLEKERFNSI
jgi:hypothetical protein